MNNHKNQIDGITFNKNYTARVLVVGEDIRKEVAKHKGVEFVSSVIGIARYEPTTQEWFLRIPSYNMNGEEIEAMPGKNLDFHQDYLDEKTQDFRSIYPPNFNFEAFVAMKSKVRADKAASLAKTSK